MSRSEEMRAVFSPSELVKLLWEFHLGPACLDRLWG